MPLTAAEKMRRYRERLKNNPEKLEEQRKKNLERIKSKYKYTKISELAENERSILRNKWKEDKRKQKLKKQGKKCANVDTSPEEENLSLNSSDSTESLKTRLKQAKTYANRLRKSRNKLKAQLDQAESRIEYLKRAYEGIRKKLYRLQKTTTDEKKKFEKESDIMKVRNEVLEASLKLTYRNCENNRERNLLKNIAKNSQGIHHNHTEWVSKKLGVRVKNRQTQKTLSKIRKPIIDFFHRDDVSRATAGKRECKTLKKDKQQIRYLNNPLHILYEKFKEEGGKAAFSTFCRFKPFYVISPSINNRNTCLCIKHSNMMFKINALKRNKIIDFSNCQDLLKHVACDPDSFMCMHGKCEKCKHTQLKYNLDNSSSDQISWQMWESQTCFYKKNSKDGEQECKTKKTVKTQKRSTVQELIKMFESDIPRFKIHSFNMYHQANCYKTCIDSLEDDEIAIHCDFSQNYECKMSEEVQAMHFGASKVQVTLHTGVIFFKGGQKSFCTISPSNVHQPHAIWAHLQPIIDLAKISVSNLKTVHVFSDGPSSQYRQKNNFYLINYYASFYNINITWSFFESGHGKGVADAIGGVVKRCLDRQVAYGRDIITATDVYLTIKSVLKTVNAFYITETEIDAIKKIIPNTLTPVKGTMDIHQVICLYGNDHIHHRILSCFCTKNKTICKCYNPIVHRFSNILKMNQDCSSDRNIVIVTEHESRKIGKNSNAINISEISLPKSTSLLIADSESISEHLLSDIDMTADLPVIFIEDVDLTQNTQRLTHDSGQNNLNRVDIIENKENNYVSIKTNQKLTTSVDSVKNPKTEVTTKHCGPKKATTYLEETRLPTCNQSRLKSKKIIPTRQPKLNKSLTCIVNRRQATCNKCNIPTNLHSLVKCIACKKYYCLTCTDGSDYFDYICNSCFGED